MAPPGGIVLLDFGMLGENCENGACTRSDVMFPVDEPEGADAASKAASATPAAVTPTRDDVAAAAVAGLLPGTTVESRPSSIIESSATLLALDVLAAALVAAMIFAAGRVLRRT